MKLSSVGEKTFLSRLDIALGYFYNPVFDDPVGKFTMILTRLGLL